MKILKADIEDLQDILDLQYIAYQSEAKLLNNFEIPPLKQTLTDIQREFNSGIILKAVNESNKIIGSVRAYAEKGTVYIGKLIVHPDDQRRGIGTALLQKIEEVCSSDRYELFTSNKSQSNIRLYEKLGYQRFEEKAVTSELCFIYLEKKK